MKNIVVTGASSLLGINTIVSLLKEDYVVKGFLRNKDKFIGGENPNLKLIEGDIRSLEDLDKVTTNCDCVIHAAAITDQNLLKYEDYYEVNVECVKNIVNAAIKNRVKKIIYVSTASEFAQTDLGVLGNETSILEYPFNKSFYIKSKKEAHDFLLTKLNEIEVTIVNPSFIIGAFDTKPSSGKIVLMGLKNKIVFCPPGGKNFVCATDVSKGIISAIKKGRNGESYLLANQNISFLDFFKLLRKLTRNKFLIIKLPKKILLLIGYMGSVLKGLGVKTNFSLENMKTISINNFYSNNKAVTELDIVFKPIENGIKDSIFWFEQFKVNS
ncbi:NAD-dependent epimerase/dehydratase family protein [Algibacter aquimarinus]|uniref:NAD-dependent epimerase/dehydratase domain-containing protein n=1 Tax=Algibacter aquimarinus TaxID=1136748 RepID=A0ABP9H874_9FLAO